MKRPGEVETLAELVLLGDPVWERLAPGEALGLTVTEGLDDALLLLVHSREGAEVAQWVAADEKERVTEEQGLEDRVGMRIVPLGDAVAE